MSERKDPTLDERCGTAAGSAAHYRRGESRCDPCIAASRESDRAYRAKNRAARAERQRAYYAANHEAQLDYATRYREANREAIRSARRAYYWANREVEAARAHAHYVENGELIAEYHRAYREANREARLAKERERRARINDALRPTAGHSRQEWAPEDDAIVRATFGEPIVAVAAQLRRTWHAVTQRRGVLRKLDRANGRSAA